MPNSIKRLLAMLLCLGELLTSCASKKNDTKYNDPKE